MANSFGSPLAYTGQGKKSMLSSFKVFLKSLKGHRFAITVSILLSVGSALFGLFIPKILGDMTTIAVQTYPNIDWAALGG